MTISAVCADENLGNTKPDSSKKDKEVKKYCFTFNNYDVGKLNEVRLSLFPLGKVIFGQEVGESGTPHLQGYINLHKKKSLSGLIKCVGIKEIHFEACKGSEEQNIVYCTKEGKWHSNFYEPPEELELITEFKPWMIDIENMIKAKADKRKVNWYWEPIGGTGKSSFCKYLCSKYGAIYIDEGKKSDLLNIIFNVKVLNSKSVICIDIPRDNGANCSYKAIEQIKNGMICNTKYETGMRLFNSPHVVIFSNFPPDTDKLSADRWNVVEIV